MAAHVGQFVPGDGLGYTNINAGDLPMPSFTREQKRQIKQYSDQVLTALNEVEDTVWDVDETAVAGVLQAALGKCCDALDALKERLPSNDMERRELARSYVAGIMTPVASSTADPAQNEGAQEEMLLAGALLPEEQRQHFMQTMEAARAGLRERMQEEWGEETCVQAEQDLVDRMLLMEAVLEEVKDTIASVDEDDLRQMAFFGVAFARYVASTTRNTVENVVDMIFDDEDLVVVDTASRFEAVDPEPSEETTDEGQSRTEGAVHDQYQGESKTLASTRSRNTTPEISGEQPRGRGHTQGRPRKARRKSRKMRLLWPSLRRTYCGPALRGLGSCLPRLSGTSASCAAAPDVAPGVATISKIRRDVLVGLALACIFLWPLVVVMVWLMAIVLAVDEALQYLYDEVACKWDITAGGEEIFCALVYAVRAWFMVFKISLKQTLRLARRQWARAAQRPGGVQQLAVDWVRYLGNACVRLGAKVLANPYLLYSKPRDTVMAFWGHVVSIRQSMNG